MHQEMQNIYACFIYNKRAIGSTCALAVLIHPKYSFLPSQPAMD